MLLLLMLLLLLLLLLLPMNDETNSLVESVVMRWFQNSYSMLPQSWLGRGRGRSAAGGAADQLHLDASGGSALPPIR
jgi:hypothetical protein